MGMTFLKHAAIDVMLSNSATSPQTYGTHRAKKKTPREQIDMDAMKPVWPPLPTSETTQQTTKAVQNN